MKPPKKLVPNLIAAAVILLGIPGSGHANDFFAMDTGTKDARHKTAGEQIALAKDLGFAGIGIDYTTPEALRVMLAESNRQQSKVFTVYLGVDISAAAPVTAQIRDAISQLKGRDTVLWLFVRHGKLKPSDPAGDGAAVPVLREIAGLAEIAGIRVALYPHADMWVERVDDAVRLARQADRKNLGVTFNLCHWLKADGQALATRLQAAKPYLFLATINGADNGAKDWNGLIQPLDTGTFDVRQVLAELQRIGYTGPIGLQHYGIKGDARANLQRSVTGWRRLQEMEPAPTGSAMEPWLPAKGWVEAGSVAVDPQNPKQLKPGPGTGILVSPGKADYLISRQQYRDVAVHAEFLIPAGSNSGLYFSGSYEVQVYDSFGVEKDKYPGIECGGIYPEWVGNANVRGHSPAVNAALPPGQWQTFDVIFRAPRFDADGRKTANARFEKVVHNGKVVQENIEVPGPTRGGFPEKAIGPLRIQGDHGPVAYRNIRIKPLQEK